MLIHQPTAHPTNRNYLTSKTPVTMHLMRNAQCNMPASHYKYCNNVSISLQTKYLTPRAYSGEVSTIAIISWIYQHLMLSIWKESQRAAGPPRGGMGPGERLVVIAPSDADIDKLPQHNKLKFVKIKKRMIIFTILMFITYTRSSSYFN